MRVISPQAAKTKHWESIIGQIGVWRSLESDVASGKSRVKEGSNFGVSRETGDDGERFELSGERTTVTLGEKTPLQFATDPQIAAYLSNSG